MTRRLDPIPLAAAALAVLMVAVYRAIVSDQDGGGALWVVVGLLIGAGGAGYASWRSAPARRVVLGATTIVLGCLGLAGLLSIGLPIILAAALCGTALLRDVLAESAAPRPTR